MNKRARYVFGSSGMIQVFYWHMAFVIAVSAASCGSTKRAFDRARADMPFDAIIVTGVPYDSVSWSTIMKARVLWAHYLYTRGHAKHVIFSGSAVYTPFVESRVMALYALQLGIPEEAILTEEKAEHSTENIYYSYHLARSLGWTRIALATDPYQGFMLRSYASRKGMEVTHLPVVFDTIRTHYPDAQAIIDPSWAYVRGFVPLPERENPFVRFLGTLGQNIKYRPHEVSKEAMRYGAPLPARR